MSHQISQKGGFQRNPGIAMAFKCQPIGIDPFFHDANGSLDAFCLGSCLWNVSPVIASCWTSCKASFNQRFQCCLIVSSYFYRQPSNTNLIENCCSGLHVTFFVTSTNHHANHPSVNHQQDQNFPMFPCYKKEISSKTVGCFMLMTYSPSRCASSWLHAIITSPVIRPMAPALMFQPETSITQFRDTALQIWSLWTLWCVWAFWQTRFMGTPTLQIFWIGKWWGVNFRNLTFLRPITHDITVINFILCQVLHLRKTTHHPKTRVHKCPVTPAFPIRLTWTCPPFMVFPLHISRCVMVFLTKLFKITTWHVIIITVCRFRCTTRHEIIFTVCRFIGCFNVCLKQNVCFNGIGLMFIKNMLKKATASKMKHPTNIGKRLQHVCTLHLKLPTFDLDLGRTSWPTLGDLRNLLSGNMIHRVLSQRVLSSLSYQVLSHNILRDNCCNWTTTTTSVSFGLFRFSAVNVHSVSSVHGAQVHRCWSRTLHTTLVLWKQTDFQPPCSLRNLQRKFQFLQKQSTLLSIAKDCLPTSFQKGVSWDHIQRNSYHYYTLHGNLRLTYLEFQIYNPFDRQIIVSCTLQAWRWTRILKTHSVVLDPLLRNDVACSPWVYQPAGLRISYPYTTYKLLQCAAQVVCHRSLSTRCPCGPLWPTSIWSSLHCKGFDYHSSLVSTLLLSFWFLRLLSLTRLFTFFNLSKLSSFPRPLPRPLLPLLFAAGFALAFATGLDVEEAPGRLLGSLAHQSLAAWPDLPQWLHFTGCGQSRAMCPRLPQLWQVMPSEPCFGPVATCTLLSRSLVSLIRVWYATTDSQTLATVVAPQWSCTNSATLSGKFLR